MIKKKDRVQRVEEAAYMILQSGMNATSGCISTLLYDLIALRLLRVKI